MQTRPALQDLPPFLKYRYIKRQTRKTTTDDEPVQGDDNPAITGAGAILVQPAGINLSLYYPSVVSG